MKPSPSFVMQIASLTIEVCGFNDEESACLESLKHIFRHHIVRESESIIHRIIVCKPNEYNLPSEAAPQWVAPCLGVAGRVPRRPSLWSRLTRLFARNREIPLYSGTCNVRCYRDAHRQVDYFIPEYGTWRVEHHATEHLTYAYADPQEDLSDGLPPMLMNVIGSQYGCYLIFASCVAVDGEALLFTGNSGVGKSTLCMELVKQGASYLGDDLALLYVKGGKAMVGSLLFPLKYYADQERVHKTKMDMLSLSQQRPSLTAPLKAAYLVQRADDAAQSYLRALPSGTMLEQLLKRTNKANTHADTRHFVTTLSSICETVPCYLLSYGNNDVIKPSFFGDHDQR